MHTSKKATRKTIILNAALALFEKSGFENTTLAQIAEASNLGVGTIYNYFEAKGDLLLEIVKSRSFVYLEDLDTVLANASLDLASSYTLFLESYLKSFSLYNRRIWRELMAHIFAREPKLMHFIYQIDEPYLEKLARLLAKYTKSGVLLPDTPVESVVSSLYSASMFSILNYIVNDAISLADLKKQLLQHSELILRGIAKQDAV